MYTKEKNALYLISYLKKYDIRDVVVSPGGTNICFVLSVQSDPYFRLFSAVDERHAGYLACGLSAETGKPVVIVCTGATSSRNYLSALTEAYYRKLPVLAITCSMHHLYVGNLRPQVTDRSAPPPDTVRLSVQCPIPNSELDELDCRLKIVRCILELKRRGGGPAHINLETSYSSDLTIKQLPEVERIDRVSLSDEIWPKIPADCKRIAVWIGAHEPFNEKTICALRNFVRSHNAVVIGDSTSNCKIEEFVMPALMAYQNGAHSNPVFRELTPDLLVRIGEMSGDYPTSSWLQACTNVWRVSQDGEVRDSVGSLKCVFEMDEFSFFNHYSEGNVTNTGLSYSEKWKVLLKGLRENEPDIPFSYLHIAKRISDSIPCEAELHLGILNPLRCMNLVGLECSRVFCNVGGFGIDGNISSLIGASLANPNKVYCGLVGDLSFFYDLNAIGNRYVGGNLRLVVVNNGEGGEFSTPGSVADMPGCAEIVHEYVAAIGHFGGKSSGIVKNIATSLGFEYFSACEKNEMERCLAKLRLGDPSGKPVLVECFTTTKSDRLALGAYREIMPYMNKSVQLRGMLSAAMPSNVKEAIKVLLK